MLDQITPIVLTYNEEPNLARTLLGLQWARSIVVVDSGSTDATLAICRADPRVRVLSRPFDTFRDQWMFALAHAGIATPWVLALDADYVVTAAGAEELARLQPTEDCGGFEAKFHYCINGRALRGSLYPPHVVLFRPERVVVQQEGHAYRFSIAGRSERLMQAILHDDRKPMSRWLQSQARYADEEAAFIAEGGTGRLSLTARLRKWLVLMPFLAPLYALFVRGTVLDGRSGWIYAGQRALAEWLISIALAERVLSRRARVD